MNSINTHGRKMTGLRKAAGESKGLRGSYDPGYLQVNYDVSTGKVWTDYHYDLGHSWHTYYHDDDIISFNICEPHTMQALSDYIHDKVNEQAYLMELEQEMERAYAALG